MRTSTLPRFRPFTAFPLFSAQNCGTNWLITVTAPRFSTSWLAPLMVSPLVLMHLGLLYGRLSTTCAPSSSILTSWTSIWLPKSPRGALRTVSPPYCCHRPWRSVRRAPKNGQRGNWRLLLALLCAIRHRLTLFA